MNMNRKKVKVERPETILELKRLSDCLAACHAQRNRLVQANMGLRKEVEKWKTLAGQFQREAGRYNEEARSKHFLLVRSDLRAANLTTEVEEKRKRIQQLEGQLGLGYKMGVGTMPLGEEERGRWRNRLHDQLARVGIWKARTERRVEVIKDLRQRLADMRDLIPQGFGRPEAQEKADAIIEGANLRRGYPVRPEHRAFHIYRAQDDLLTEAVRRAITPPSLTKEEIQKMVADEVAKQIEAAQKPLQYTGSTSGRITTVDLGDVEKWLFESLKGHITPGSTLKKKPLTKKK